MAKSEETPSSGGESAPAESSAIKRLFEGQATKSTETGVFLQPVGSADSNPFPEPGGQEGTPSDASPSSSASNADSQSPSGQAQSDDS